MKKTLIGITMASAIITFTDNKQINAQEIINQDTNEILISQNLDFNNSLGYLVADGHMSGLPKNFADFKQRCQTMARTPEGAIKMYFDAVFAYIDPNTRAEGEKMLGYIMHEPEDWHRRSSYSTFTSRLKDKNMNYVFRSFAVGTSPQNGYKMSPDNYDIEIIKITKEADYSRALLKSTGADSDRAVWVKEYDGLWYVINNAGSYSSIKPPQ